MMRAVSGRHSPLRWIRSELCGRRRTTAAVISVFFAASGLALTAPAAVAAASTVVSLTFDNGTLSQYALGYQQALQPHGVNATF